MKYSVRDYKDILDFCAEPKTRQHIVDKFGFNHAGVYRHLYRLCPALLTEFKLTIGCSSTSHFIAVGGKSKADIVTLYKEVNGYWKDEDVSFMEPKKPIVINDFAAPDEKSAARIKAEADARLSHKEKYNPAKTIDRSEPGVTKVSMSAYHSGNPKEKLVRPKNGVSGSTLSMVV